MLNPEDAAVAEVYRCDLVDHVYESTNATVKPR